MDGNRSVFVGNIPFEYTEQQLRDLFETAGPVSELRIAFDTKTGKAKGYGFVEFRDHETALSAIRNLDGTAIGTRRLKVSLASERSEESKRNSAALSSGGSSSRDKKPRLAGSAAQLQSTGAPGFQQVATELEDMSINQVYEVVSSVREMAIKNPDLVRHLLLNNAPFLFALLQSQVMLGMINPAVLQQYLQSSNMAPMTPMTPMASMTSMTPMAPMAPLAPMAPMAPMMPVASHAVPIPGPLPSRGTPNPPIGYPQPPPANSVAQLPMPPILNLPPEQLPPLFDLVRKARLMSHMDFQQLAPGHRQYIQSVLSDIKMLLQLPQHQLDQYPPRQRDLIHQFRIILGH